MNYRANIEAMKRSYEEKLSRCSHLLARAKEAHVRAGLEARRSSYRDFLLDLERLCPPLGGEPIAHI